jgi:hypothetical protein
MLNESKNIYRDRVDFSKIKGVFPMPDMLAIQTKSYREFLAMELLPEERRDIGLQSDSRPPSKTSSRWRISRKRPSWILFPTPSATGNANAAASKAWTIPAANATAAARCCPPMLS